MSHQINPKNKRKFDFTKPKRVNTAMHNLEGLLKGIAMDDEITVHEAITLRDWLVENEEILRHDPFAELKSLIDNSLEDGNIDENEKKDILWFCDKFTTEDNYFSAITSDLQRLHGILGGIMADNLIEKHELDGLRSWLDDHEHLNNCWPFDEIDSLVTLVLEDGKIDDREHELLLDFFGDFFKLSNQASSKTPMLESSTTITGICTIDPEIIIKNRLFSFTGFSKRAPREKIIAIINESGAIFSEEVTEKVDYLVIGADGNPCWIYACYGRKIELAIQWQKRGEKILILHENDFWRAIEAAKQ